MSKLDFLSTKLFKDVSGTLIHQKVDSKVEETGIVWNIMNIKNIDKYFYNCENLSKKNLNILQSATNNLNPNDANYVTEYRKLINNYCHREKDSDGNYLVINALWDCGTININQTSEVNSSISSLSYILNNQDTIISKINENVKNSIYNNFSSNVANGIWDEKKNSITNSIKDVIQTTAQVYLLAGQELNILNWGGIIEGDQCNITQSMTITIVASSITSQIVGLIKSSKTYQTTYPTTTIAPTTTLAPKGLSKIALWIIIGSSVLVLLLLLFMLRPKDNYQQLIYRWGKGKKIRKVKK